MVFQIENYFTIHRKFDNSVPGGIRQVLLIKDLAALHSIIESSVLIAYPIHRSLCQNKPIILAGLRIHSLYSRQRGVNS